MQIPFDPDQVTDDIDPKLLQYWLEHGVTMQQICKAFEDNAKSGKQADIKIHLTKNTAGENLKPGQPVVWGQKNKTTSLPPFLPTVSPIEHMKSMFADDPTDPYQYLGMMLPSGQAAGSGYDHSKPLLHSAGLMGISPLSQALGAVVQQALKSEAYFGLPVHLPPALRSSIGHIGIVAIQKFPHRGQRVGVLDDDGEAQDLSLLHLPNLIQRSTRPEVLEHVRRRYAPPWFHRGLNGGDVVVQGCPRLNWQRQEFILEFLDKWTKRDPEE